MCWNLRKGADNNEGWRIKNNPISTKIDSEGNERSREEYSPRKKFGRPREGAKKRMGDIRIIGLDTNIFMNVLREESGTESSAILLEQMESGNVIGVVSTLVLAEIATLFYREGDFEGGKRAIELLEDFPNLMRVDLTSDVVDSCAKLKVKYKLSLADAIVLNAALVLSADVFVTKDPDFDSVDVIPIKRPEDVV